MNNDEQELSLPSAHFRAEGDELIAAIEGDSHVLVHGQEQGCERSNPVQRERKGRGGSRGQVKGLGEAQALAYSQVVVYLSVRGGGDRGERAKREGRGRGEGEV